MSGQQFHVGDLDRACRAYLKARLANESEATPEWRDAFLELLAAANRLAEQIKRHVQGKEARRAINLN